MDLSPEYVQMCRQAKEIQAIHPKFYGINIKCSEYGIDTEGEFIGFSHIEGEGAIWLPRQDQLQAMVFKKTALSLACCFKDYIVRPMFDELMPNRKEHLVFMMKASMEQLWLCFVMHSLYKLRWNDSAWVAE